jgi:hypothetical protein
MRQNIIVIDDFYSNVDAVREFALSQPFNVTGNYPGVRTENFLNESTKETIQDILLPHAGRVINWLETSGEGYSGAFQITTGSNKSWIHNDAYNNWAGVLYLTPDAPVTGGTGFFRSKLDGSFTGPDDHKCFPDAPSDVWTNMDMWDKVAEVGNVYNRIVLFRADQWHTSLDYFGEDFNTGRLTQVFFIKTER